MVGMFTSTMYCPVKLVSKTIKLIETEEKFIILIPLYPLLLTFISFIKPPIVPLRTLMVSQRVMHLIIISRHINIRYVFHEIRID